MANGILWQLVGNVNPLGEYAAGLNKYNQQQNILQQIAGQEQDRQFRQETDARNFQRQTSQDAITQANWEKQFAQNAQNQNAMRSLQQQQLDLQKQTASTADIRAIPMQDGSTQLVRINKQTGVPEPINIPQQQQQQNNPDTFVPPGVDAKTWRVERTKNIVKDLENAPQSVAKADNMLKVIDSVLNDPVLPNATGVYSKLQAVPGIPQYGFGQKVAQLQGQAFLQAFESLKGGGQITEVEGKKATDAIGRLNSAQSANDFKAALNDLKEIVNTARTRQIQLQQRYSPNTTQQNPQQRNLQDPLGIR